MSAFPTLKTGAVLQYPAARRLEYSTTVFEFVDGSDQRFREYPSVARKWIIDVTRLDEGELAEVERFFLDNQGAYGEFVFTDPWDEAEYPNCSVENPEAVFELLDVNGGAARIIVAQNRV